MIPHLVPFHRSTSALPPRLPTTHTSEGDEAEAAYNTDGPTFGDVWTDQLPQNGAGPASATLRPETRSSAAATLAATARSIVLTGRYPLRSPDSIGPFVSRCVSGDCSVVADCVVSGQASDTVRRSRTVANTAAKTDIHPRVTSRAMMSDCLPSIQDGTSQKRRNPRTAPSVPIDRAVKVAARV
jgi:hypothetical protein